MFQLPGAALLHVTDALSLVSKLPMHTIRQTQHTQVLYTREHQREAMKDAVEMAVLSHIRHPGIVSVYSCFTDMVEDGEGGSTYIINSVEHVKLINSIEHFCGRKWRG